MKLDELLGAEVIAIQGEEGQGCDRCGILPGHPQYSRLYLKLLNDEICELTTEPVCPPDMDTGEMKQWMVAKKKPLDNHKE